MMLHLRNDAKMPSAWCTLLIWIKITTAWMSGSIKVKADNKQLQIAVEDTGKGIPIDLQERVFERFYKVDSFVQGIGLGLTVARRSAQLLGGTLTIDPDYTTGCRFVITLPV